MGNGGIFNNYLVIHARLNFHCTVTGTFIQSNRVRVRIKVRV